MGNARGLKSTGEGFGGDLHGGVSGPRCWRISRELVRNVALCTLLAASLACSSSTKATVDAGHTPPGDSGKPLPDASIGIGASVLEHHLHPSRDGFYTDASLTTTAAANVKALAGFSATVDGIIYGQPLYVDGWKTGQDAVFVATDHNHVTALDATTGKVLWDKTLGPFITQLHHLMCGGPYPYYGVTATPVIDFTTRTLYAESFQTPDDNVTFKHYLFALSIDDGSTKTGWPVEIAAKVNGFDPALQHDRGALALVQGTVYIPYAGLNGDCGTYNGWVVGVSTTDPTTVEAWSTTAERGGIWGSVTSDGTSAYAVTGNTSGATSWGGGEALLRFNAGPKFSGKSTDYFTPSNWQSLDNSDADLGSAASVFVDVAGANPSTLAVAAGKAGVAHLLNRGDLGGVGTGDGQNGEGLFSMSISGSQVKGTPAAYKSAKGTYVAIRADGGISVCPGGTSGDLLAMTVTKASPPKLVPAWCASSQGAGSPIATTTDGTSDALVWIVSATGSNRLLAFDGDTGAAVYTGGGTAEQLGSIEHWTSPIVAKGRFYVGGQNAVYALTAK
jgi:outer membrane protein assembly factor BamB